MGYYGGNIVIASQYCAGVDAGMNQPHPLLLGEEGGGGELGIRTHSPVLVETYTGS